MYEKGVLWPITCFWMLFDCYFLFWIWSICSLMLYRRYTIHPERRLKARLSNEIFTNEIWSTIDMHNWGQSLCCAPAYIIIVQNFNEVSFFIKFNNTIWSGIQASGGQTQLTDGGLELNPQLSRKVTSPETWSGSIWVRTGCTFDACGDETCTTWDRGNGLYCDGAFSEPPAL